MSETKNLLVSTGGADAVPMTTAQYRNLMARMPPQDRRRVYVRGNVTGVATDNAGQPSSSQMSHEEVTSRMDRGEDPIALPGDGKLDAVRRAGVDRRKREVAGSTTAKALLAINKVTPFVGQALQDAAAGPGVAAQARMEMLEANRGWSMGLDAASLAVGGVGAAKVLSKFAPGMATTMGLKGFGNMMAGGATADTYLYAEYLANSNTPFRAEDYGRELAIGALFNLPLAGGAAARGAIIKGAGKVLKGGAAMGTAADFYITRAVLSGSDKAAAAGYAQKGAAFRLISRQANKLRGKRARTGGHIDPLGDAQAAAKDQQKRISQATAKKFEAMTPEQRTAVVDEMRGLTNSDADINVNAFNKAVDEVNLVRTNVKILDKTIDGVNQKTGNWTKGIGGKPSKKQAAAFQTEMTGLLAELKNSGFQDVTNFLEETIHLDKGGKHLVNPHTQFGKLIQARLDARLKSATIPGAAQADEALRRVIDNSEIWGKGKHPQIAKDVNDAIDKIADAQATLKDINLPKNPDAIKGNTGTIDTINAQIDIIEEAYAVLQRRKMLTYNQTAGIRKTLKQARDANLAGKKAYGEVAKLNDLREIAHGTNTERLGRVVQAAPDFKAAQNLSALEEANRLSGFGKAAINALQKGSIATTATAWGGVMYLRKMDRESKNAMFEHLQTELPMLTGAPELLEERFSGMLGATDAADPTVTTMAGMAAAKGIYYLAQAMPKRRNTLYATTTPITQQESFLQKYAAMMDPISVGYAALEGRATPDMIEAIKVTQPAMYAEISNFLSEALMEVNPKKASRKTIVGVNAFLGGIDPLWHGDVLFQLQNHYAQNAQQQGQLGGGAQGGGMAGGGQMATPNPTQPENNFTFTQRLTSY